MGRKILITVLSPMQNQEYTYQCENGVPVVAKWTNEAGLKYCLRESPDYSDIVCLCSAETDTDEYKNRVSEIVYSMGEQYRNINIKPISYSKQDDIRQIVGCLTKEFKFSNQDTVCIDTSGGFRSIVYLLIYLFRYFEYIGVKINSAIYSSIINKNTSEGKIEEITDTFRMFTLINGANEFISTGNPRTLRNYFSNTQKPEITELLDAMKKFYDSMTLCGVGDSLEKSMEQLQIALDRITDSNSLNTDSFDEERLKDLLGVIKDKFFYNKDGRYLGLLEWCLDNDLLQQAITIYVEKLPKAYFTELDFLSLNYDRIEKKTENITVEDYQEYLISPPGGDVKSLAQRIKTDIEKNDNNRPGKINDPVEKEILKFVLELRTTFYDKNDSRVQNKSYKQNDINLLNKTNFTVFTLPKTFSGILNDMNNIIHAYKADKNKHSGSKKPAKGKGSVSIVDKLDGVLNGCKYSYVDLNITKTQYKKLCLDYLYIKYIRNRVNHAAENSKDNKSFQDKISKENYQLYSFPTTNNYSADKLKAFLRQSVDYIKMIKDNIRNNER